MPNEVLIIVRASDQTKPVFDRIRRDARDLGDEIGVDITARVNETIEREASRGSGGGFERAGERIGDRIGTSIGQRIRERIRSVLSRGGDGGEGGDGGRATVDVDVDVDRQSFAARMAGLAKTAGTSIQSGVQSGLSLAFSGGFIGNLLKVALIAPLVGLIVPALGAAVTSGILLALGGGAIGVGIAAAFQHPRIKTAATGLKDELKTIFNDFGSNFLGPLEDFLVGGGEGGKQGLLGVFRDLKPAISDLGKALAPVAAAIGDGLIGFLQNVLPGALRAIEDSAPVLETLAGKLPGLGEDLSHFFDSIGDAAPDASVFVGDLIDGLGLLIRTLGVVLEWLSAMYVGARTAFLALLGTAVTAFTGVAHAAAIAFGWVPGLGPKLRTAYGKINDFREDVNRELAKIRDKTITINIRQVYSVVGRAVTDTGRLLSGRAHGGIQGAATGGARSGLTWVGEHGPELVDIAPGSQVHSNPDSMRIASSGGGGVPMVVQLVLDGAVIARAMLDPQRKIIKNEFGGSAQAAFGQG